MSVGERLKEERLRLGLSQERFASLAGVAKNTAINWEKGASSPTANALAAWAAEGADALYILSGRRTAADAQTSGRSIDDDLADIRRKLIDQAWPARAPVEYQHSIRLLASMLAYDKELMTPEQLSLASEYQAMLDDPDKLARFRAADYAQNRKQREDMKAAISGWFGTDDDAAPGEPIIGHLADLAIEYSVPYKFLVDLIHDIREERDAKWRRQAT